jgi:hypothetical protein
LRRSAEGGGGDSLAFILGWREKKGRKGKEEKKGKGKKQREKDDEKKQGNRGGRIERTRKWCYISFWTQIWKPLKCSCLFAPE